MNELEKRQLKELLEWKKNMESSHSIPLNIDQSINGRFFGTGFSVSKGGTGASSLTGILKGNGTSAFTAIVPKSGSGTFYVALSSGGVVTTKVDWTDGIITAIT